MISSGASFEGLIKNRSVRRLVAKLEITNVV